MLSNLNNKNWRLGLFTALFFICVSSFAQQTYFQQEVNYTMSVKLDDVNHSLTAFQKIQYVNNSASALNVIYFHLWPNAYKNNSTALAKQLLQHDNSKLYFSDASERGYIDSLDFKVNEKKIVWELDAQNPDICKLILNSPLKSLDTLIITTPFFVKIPDAKFSRLGHLNQAYFITQWYPKPAVFDKSGWHPMPYLDQGEFYSEFGSFDVSISLPDNYLLAATGDRIDADEEEDFLNNKVIETLAQIDQKNLRITKQAEIESSKTFKTVRFKQFRVHDFAWFADKSFNVVHDQIEMPVSKRLVDTWVFFTPQNFDLWKDAITYVNESTIFYSYLNGDYPYNNITAVDGTIMAGGGMEYPNITVIGSMSNKFDLDVTIAHEIGHNWFYGVLGSNERDEPAMDEGINSFYEMRYIRAKYPLKKLSDYVGRDSTFKLLGFNKTPYWKEKEFLFNMSLRARTDQAINIPSQDFTTFNYGSVIYSKTPIILDYLMEYMGEQTFDKAMRFYYEQFRFKHPTTEDFTKTLSFFSGKDLDWFSAHLLKSTDHIDYKIKSVKQNSDGSFSLKVKNKTGVPAPFNIYGFKNNKPAGIVWYDGFQKTKTLDFPPSDIDYFKIDGNDKMPDINRKNNYIKAHGIFKKYKPLQLNFFTKLEDPKKFQVNYAPVGGVNYYNRFMLGLALHNYSFYKNRFEYLVAPMFAFNTKTLVGFTDLNYNIFPKKYFQQITVGVTGKTFAYDYFSSKIKNQIFSTDYKDLYLNYYRVAPYVKFEIKKKNANNPIRQYISYSSVNLFTDSLDQAMFADSIFKGAKKKNTYSFVNELRYDLINKRLIDPFSLYASVQHNFSMAKLSLTFNYQFTITKKYFFDLRAFVGSFLSGKNPEKSYYAFRPAGYRGSDDYLFDYNYVGRNEGTDFSASQFTEKDGNLKVPVVFGRSSSWMASLNLKSPRLFILPVRVFADVMICDNKFLLNDKFLWDAGLNVTILKDIVEVYIPLAYSSDIRTTLDLNNISFANRIRFTLNIHKLVPKDFVKNNFLEQ